MSLPRLPAARLLLEDRNDIAAYPSGYNPMSRKEISMTFSIVACDLEEQAWGVAVASKFPAVGAVVPFAQANAGALATQSFANTSFGPRGLVLMGTGLSAQETLD